MTSTPRPAVAQPDDGRLAQAFRELHGRGLHGFALLVSLGEVGIAERVAAEALAAGAAQASALRHPERAAAWLRSRALRGLHQGVGRGQAPATDERRAVLALLGVDDRIYEGLAGLGLEARAALIASAVERFESMDTEMILGASPPATRKVVARARDQYLQAVSGPRADGGVNPPPAAGGVIATRVREVSERAMFPGWKPE